MTLGRSSLWQGQRESDETWREGVEPRPGSYDDMCAFPSHRPSVSPPCVALTQLGVLVVDELA